ncbi:fused iron-hydroxamate transporter subunits of ABC superfamily: membrane components [uncultured Alphaproteobacteria bacterium]|uniref:Fused iron-hydroxamate transporter subunits of ABC superfamily: membrane components n=1 Tax=uncultured Alphaproteobacteria bacterium TaxID=91750 RepID=A0A212KJU7_9PROT|nr:fused iron-hydroxamate transporter subunits of ABC superfamily: membrane components [uncultured Alphaproteobacteria bacterium]
MSRLLLLAACAFGLAFYNLVSGGDAPTPELEAVVRWQATLPRLVVAPLAGAALGLSGAILQRVLRNPLAEPATLGIAPGAQLALGLAALHAPGLPPQPVAFVGGAAAAALLLGLTWRRGLEPVAVALAGMMLGLTLSAASAALVLANGEYLFSLLIWGGGSLVQQGWGAVRALAVALALGGCGAALLLRPLALFGLGDDGARGLGLAVGAIRLAALGIAVALATATIAEVGVIAFVGLAAPAIAGLAGARGARARLLAAPPVGALLLSLADGLIQAAAGDAGERIPAGVATALLGGPLLLWLLPRLRLFEWPSLAAAPPVAPRAPRPDLRLASFALLLAAVAAAALLIGRTPAGWGVALGGAWEALAPWRWPRLTVAAASGAMLGVSGAILQRLTANPLAGPEILGVGAGAGLGLAALLFAVAAPGLGAQLAASALGAVAALALVLALARRAGFGPDRLLLGGVAVAAFGGAAVSAGIAAGGRRSLDLLRWLSGATDAATPAQAHLALGGAVLAVALAPLLAPGLRLLPLGDAAAAGLGLAVARWRAASVLAAGALAAAAALFVGPLSFVGLVAPHLARLSGLSDPLRHAWGAALAGAALLAASDWLARTLAFPYQLPLGLFAALIGGAYLVWLLARGR